jgi:hypothetical protein
LHFFIYIIIFETFKLPESPLIIKSSLLGWSGQINENPFHSLKYFNYSSVQYYASYPKQKS